MNTRFRFCSAGLREQALSLLKAQAEAVVHFILGCRFLLSTELDPAFIWMTLPQVPAAPPKPSQRLLSWPPTAQLYHRSQKAGAAPQPALPTAFSAHSTQLPRPLPGQPCPTGPSLLLSGLAPDTQPLPTLDFICLLGGRGAGLHLSSQEELLPVWLPLTAWWASLCIASWCLFYVDSNDVALRNGATCFLPLHPCPCLFENWEQIERTMKPWNQQRPNIQVAGQENWPWVPGGDGPQNSQVIPVVVQTGDSCNYWDPVPVVSWVDRPVERA